MTHNSYNIRDCFKYLAVAACFGFASSGIAAAEYYRWKDADGVVHFTDQRPENIEVETVKPRTPDPVPRTFAQQAKDKADALAEVEAEADAEAAEAAEWAELQANAAPPVDPTASKELRCQQERERLAILEQNEGIHMQDANGNLKKLNNQEIQREISVTQNAISLLCN